MDRYDLVDYCGSANLVEKKSGDYVLYSDHLAEIEKWIKIAGENQKSANQSSARIQELTEALEEIVKDADNRPGHEKWEYYCKRLYDILHIAKEAVKIRKEVVNVGLNQTEKDRMAVLKAIEVKNAPAITAAEKAELNALNVKAAQ
jgi:hypothetical protein